jgi:hypothetical protein
LTFNFKSRRYNTAEEKGAAADVRQRVAHERVRKWRGLTHDARHVILHVWTRVS